MYMYSCFKHCKLQYDVTSHTVICCYTIQRTVYTKCNVIGCNRSLRYIIKANELFGCNSPTAEWPQESHCLKPRGHHEKEATNAANIHKHFKCDQISRSIQYCLESINKG